ncbi:MAG: heavy-metal-associated domain-containing protein [Thermoleophilaceae bacterium]
MFHETGPDQTPTATVEPGEGRLYQVKGMTCEHCAGSVTEEVEQVAGVTGIDVNLENGSVVVRGDGFSDADIRTAVDEAGYEVVGAHA